MKRKIKDIFPDYAVNWLVIILCCNLLVYYGARFVTRNRMHYDISTEFDYMIPFMPWTVTIYLGCYVFWTISYIAVLSENSENAKKFALSEISGKIICFIIYVIFPTTMKRGNIQGNSFFENILGFVYLTDSADNLFPSIHCFISWLCYLEIRKWNNISRKYKIGAMIIAFVVFISTLTVKQHVIPDVISGFLLAEFTFRIFHNEIHKKESFDKNVETKKFMS